MDQELDEPTQAIVYVIDDDEAVLDALDTLLTAEGFETLTYTSANDFLGQYDPAQAGCIILDVQMPGINGLELQSTLKDIGAILPIIFMSGQGNVPIAVQAMKSGAFEFLQKPFSDKVLLEHISNAMAQDGRNRSQLAAKQSILSRIEKLSPREKQVMHGVSAGKANKVIARELGLSPRTVEIYRSHVMMKMQVNTAIELVKLLDNY